MENQQFDVFPFEHGGFSSVMLVFGGVDKKDMIFNSQNYSFCSKKTEFQ